MANSKMIHDGHRQRLKQRFLNEGLDHFNDHQVLELLLFYCMPRRDTNPISHALLAHFGNLDNVLTATPEELKKVPGVGDSTATFLPLFNALQRFRANNRPKERFFHNLNECADYLMHKFENLRCETVYLLCLDAKGKKLCCKKVGDGGINSAAVPIRKIVETALNAGATTVILAHNHPSGIAIPSNEDQLTTRQLAATLGSVDITLADHVVVADGDWVSMRQSGMYNPDNCQFLV